MDSETFKLILTHPYGPNLFEKFTKNEIFNFMFDLMKKEYDNLHLKLGYFTKEYSQKNYKSMPLVTQIEDYALIEEMNEKTSENCWVFVGMNNCTKELGYKRKLNYEELKNIFFDCFQQNLTKDNEFLRFVFLKWCLHITQLEPSNFSEFNSLDELKKTKHFYLNESNFLLNLNFLFD